MAKVPTPPGAKSPYVSAGGTHVDLRPYGSKWRPELPKNHPGHPANIAARKQAELAARGKAAMLETNKLATRQAGLAGKGQMRITPEMQEELRAIYDRVESVEKHAATSRPTTKLNLPERMDIKEAVGDISKDTSPRMRAPKDGGWIEPESKAVGRPTVKLAGPVEVAEDFARQFDDVDLPGERVFKSIDLPNRNLLPNLRKMAGSVPKKKIGAKLLQLGGRLARSPLGKAGKRGLAAIGPISALAAPLLTPELGHAKPRWDGPMYQAPKRVIKGLQENPDLYKELFNKAFGGVTADDLINQAIMEGFEVDPEVVLALDDIQGSLEDPYIAEALVEMYEELERQQEQARLMAQDQGLEPYAVGAEPPIPYEPGNGFEEPIVDDDSLLDDLGRIAGQGLDAVGRGVAAAIRWPRETFGDEAYNRNLAAHGVYRDEE